LVVLAGGLVYSNSLSGPFIFDDVKAIVENPTIRHLWPIGRVLSPPRESGVTASGRPLLNLSLAVSYALSRTAVWGYHVLNLAIHLAAALLLFGVVRRTLDEPEPRGRFGAEAPAFVVAVLFVLHPLQTASVTYVVQRAESLMSALLLLTLYCFIRAMSSRRRDLWLGAAVIACLLGMATKESMAAAPLLVLLYDRTFHAGTFRAALRARWRFYVALFATWGLLAYLVLSNAGRGGTVGFGAGVSPWSYALTQIFAVTHYLRLALWPAPLVFDYGTGLVQPSLALAARALVLLLLVATTVLAVRRWPRAGFLGACFFAVLAPSSSVVPVVTEPMAEHRMYLPLAALIVLATTSAWRRFGLSGLALLLAVVPFYASATYERNDLYRHPIALWQETMDERPDNWRADENLADALVAGGQYGRAVALYEKALRRDPAAVTVHSRLGFALYSLGRVDEASAEFHKELEFAPRNAVALYNLGNIALQRGGVDEAIAYYQRALSIKPEYGDALANLGSAYYAKDRIQEAVQSYRQALALDPDAAFFHTNLGNALTRLDRFDEAIQEYQTALALDPSSAEAAQSLSGARAHKRAH